MRILLLWSGGVESTSLLKWHLENTDDEMFVHRLILHNTENRDKNESKAIETLLPLLQSIRPFNFDTSEISICGGTVTPTDKLLYLSIGAIAMQKHNCTEIRRGYCAEDQWSRRWMFHRIRNRFTNHLIYDKAISLEHNYMRKAISLTHFLPEGTTLEDVTKIHETSYWPKAKHVKYLGDLFQYTWSCRYPVDGHKCGKCHSCLERAAAENGTSHLEEIAEQIRNNPI